MPNLVKIGFSRRDPINRALDLKASTGVPYPYEVIYDVLVYSPREVEQLIHKNLKALKADKEWFSCDWLQAVSSVREAVKCSGEILCEKEYEIFNDFRDDYDRRKREEKSEEERLLQIEIEKHRLLRVKLFKEEQ